MKRWSGGIAPEQEDGDTEFFPASHQVRRGLEAWGGAGHRQRRTLQRGWVGSKGLALLHFHKPTPLLFSSLWESKYIFTRNIKEKHLLESYKRENAVKLPIFDWVVQISFNVQNTLSFQSSASQSHSLDNCHLCIYQLTHPPTTMPISLSFSTHTCTYTSLSLSLSYNLFLPLSIGD